jgi:hypothetical protein
VITGRQVIAALGVVVLATAVVPPVAAWWLNARRIDATASRANALAPLLRGDRGTGVVCGPGQLPDPPLGAVTAVHDAWVGTAILNPALLGDDAPADAWGRCFVFDADAHGRGTTAWLLSAGPNGAIDTPRGAPALVGDDIGVVVR